MSGSAALTPASTLPGGPDPAAGVPDLLRPLDGDEVAVTGGFWADLQELNRHAVLDHCAHWVEEVGWAGNFDRASSGEPFEHAGIEFTDSEVYKLLEAMALEIGRTGDENLEARFASLVDRVAAAQDEDGYLHTAFGRPWQRPRYSDLAWGHELYCFGHLFQAAAARIRSGRGGPLPEVARRLAEHVYAEFGPSGRVAICGHPEIEPALAELWRATGEDRHLELAALFVERRGHGLLGDVEWGRAYFQDDVPVREATVLRGHAVRALYLAAGALEVAAGTGDADLWRTVAGQYDRTVARRTYVTGGMGSHHQDEAFGEDHELPPDRAYAETCAAIASMRVAHRLLTASGDPRYGDLVERTLLNAVLVSPRSDGRAFFYTNTLHQRTPGEEVPDDRVSPRARSGLRAPWFEVSCCPTNLARTLAGVPSLIAGMGRDGLWVHQYGRFSVRTRDRSGAPVAVDVESDYPHDGEVVVRLLSGLRAGRSVTMRVPRWSRSAARLTVAGAEVAVEGDLAVVRGPLPEGAVAVLQLAMEPRLTEPDGHLDAVRGQVLVEQGPWVLALEDVDLPDGTTVADVAMLADQPLGLEGGTTTAVLEVGEPRNDPAWPYGSVGQGPPGQVTGWATGRGRRTVRVPLRRYADWGQRGPSTMRVFLPLGRPDDGSGVRSGRGVR